MTKFQFLSDITLRISAGKPSDDLELEYGQLAFWLDQILNALVKKSLDEKIKSKEGIDPVYFYFEFNKDVIQGNENGKSVYYIQLDNEPMNLYRDRAIVRVANTDGFDLVDKVKVDDIDTLSNLRFSKPSISNIKYHRKKDRLYLYGIDSNSYKINNFDIVYVPLTKALDDLDDDDQIYVSEDLIPLIAEALKQEAKDELFNSSNDLTNDSIQDNPQPKQ